MTHCCNLPTTDTPDFNPPWFCFFFFIQLSPFLCVPFRIIFCSLSVGGLHQRLTASVLSVSPAGCSPQSATLHSAALSQLQLSHQTSTRIHASLLAVRGFRRFTPARRTGGLAELVLSLRTTCAHFRSVTPLGAPL